MLRITYFKQDASLITVKLEGKLLQPWIDEVQSLFTGADADTFPRLNLSGLSYVDRPGTEMLNELIREGVRIESCSPFVAELLRCDDHQNR
jgi:hypothetical protein